MSVLVGALTLNITWDTDGDGLPDWWEWKYFGTYSYSGTNLDTSGNTLLNDYLNGVAPANDISFTAHMGNQHFNTTNATGSYLVLSGVPSYEATLINASNLDEAVWSNYDSTVHLNLGPTDGVYQVWIRLKGFTTNAPPVWIGTTVYLDRTVPALFISNPTNSVIAQPILQLQGCSSESLASLTYDLSNAAAVVTDQRGQILGDPFFDTNQWQYTTDYFQCFDIPLTNGMNLLTVHATDLAGNVTVTNIPVTLDYSTATNPVIQLAWPQDGMEICQSSFTLRGWTEDSSASVSAQIVDTNGDTNVVSGDVERTGNLWVENLPLADGTNLVTLFVTNSAGLSSETNIAVVKSDMTLALTSIDGDLWGKTVNVSGIISDPTAAIYVNGIEGANNGDGTWNATNVPVSDGGVASFDMSATPEGGGDPDASTNSDKPTEMILDSAHWTMDGHSDMGDPEGWELDQIQGSYDHKSGGTQTEHFEQQDTNQVIEGSTDTTTTIAPDFSTMVHWQDSDGYEGDYEGQPMNIPWEIGALNEQHGNPTSTYNKTSRVKVSLHIGGKASGQAIVQVVSGIGTEQMENFPYARDIAPGDLTVEGLGKALGADRQAYGTAAIGSTVSVNLNASVFDHTFGDGAGADEPYIIASSSTTNADLETNTPQFCVGQQVNFTLAGLLPYQDSLQHWTLPEKYVNEQYQFSSTCTSYRKNTDLLTNLSTSCWFVNGTGGKVSMNISLHFSNGQDVQFAKDGSISVYRPTINSVDPSPPFAAIISSGTPPMLSLENGPMNFDVTINSKYDGSFGLTQLVNMFSETFIPPDVPVFSSTYGDFYLDWQEYYDGPKPVSQHCRIDDAPGQPLLTIEGDYTGNWKVYVRFAPSGGIPITLGRIDWNWAATALAEPSWRVTSDGVDGPILYNDDSFPVWTDVKSGGN